MRTPRAESSAMPVDPIPDQWRAPDAEPASDETADPWSDDLGRTEKEAAVPAA